MNMSSFLRNSKRLLKVKLPEYFNVSSWLNITSLFQGCENLLSLTGFENKFKSLYSLQYVLASTISLQECDLTIPPVLMRKDRALYCFAKKCGYVDFDMLFSNNALAGTKDVDVAQAFNDATFKVDSVINGSYLWNDHTKNWSNIKACFSNCDKVIRAQVPKSWGGTASDDIIVKKFWTGTQQEYDALTVIHDETFYIIKES